MSHETDLEVARAPQQPMMATRMTAMPLERRTRAGMEREARSTGE